MHPSKSSHISLLSFLSVTVVVQVPITTHLDFVKAFYLLPMPPVSSPSSILLSEILPFKDYSFSWRIISEFWASFTTLHYPSPTNTYSLRWTTSYNLVFQPHTSGHCLHLIFSSFNFCAFNVWEAGKLSFPFLPLNPAKSSSWLVHVYVFIDFF